MKLSFQFFRGLVPRTSRRLLPDDTAQTANNVDLLKGSLKPYKTTSVDSVLAGADRQTIYKYNGGWLEWAGDVDVAKGPIPNDQRERIYYTDGTQPKVRMVRVRENSKAFTSGQIVRWSSGDTVWLCAASGTTAATAPSITGVAIGSDINDGTVLWRKVSDMLFGADEIEYDLGLPAPTNTPAVASQNQTSTSWTRTWGYQFEDANGVILSSGSLTEGTDITEGTAGTVYTLATLPSGTGTFVLYFDAYSSGGSYLGRLYPNISAYASNSDFYLSGASATAAQVNQAGSPQATFTITYDTSRAGGYDVTRSYVYTFVTDAGEEGPPSEASAATDVSPTQDALISNMDTTFAGNQNVTKKRIYRTVTGNTGTQYQYVDEVDLADATYTDTKSDADTGEALPSALWSAPPDDLQGLVVLPGAYMAGFTGNSVWFSEPLYPHAWPESYEIVVDHKIIGLAVNAAGLVVMTDANPYIMVGSSPEATTSEKIDSNQACVSKRSIANVDDMNGSVIYASPDGLVMVVGGMASLITKAHYTREQWQGKVPASLFGIVHDQKYFGFFSGETIIMDFDEGLAALTTTDQTASGGYSDPETDTLYLVEGSDVVVWNGGSTSRTVEWKSKEFFIRTPIRWVCARVSAETYENATIRMHFYRDDVLERTVTVPGEKVFKIPKMARGNSWSVGLTTNVEIFGVLLSTSVTDR